MGMLWAAAIAGSAALASFLAAARHYARLEQAGKLEAWHAGYRIDLSLVAIIILGLALFFRLSQP